MTFDRNSLSTAKNFGSSMGGHEADPWSLFPAIKIFSGETHRVKFLIPASQSVDLWIHDWKGKFHTRTICSSAHYGQECDICGMLNSYGNPCYPKYMRLFLAWDYSLIGATWVPKKGPNEGVPQAIPPYGVISIPKGEEYTNWTALDNANAQGFGFPDSPMQGMIWQLAYVPEAGFQVPQSIPEQVLGATATQIDPSIQEWISKASESDKVAQMFATVHGILWERFGLQKPPDAPKQQGAAAGGQTDAKKGSRGRGRGAAAQAPASAPAQQFVSPGVPTAAPGMYPGVAQPQFQAQAPAPAFQQPVPQVQQPGFAAPAQPGFPQQQVAQYEQPQQQFPAFPGGQQQPQAPAGASQFAQAHDRATQAMMALGAESTPQPVQPQPAVSAQAEILQAQLAAAQQQSQQYQAPAPAFVPQQAAPQVQPPDQASPSPEQQVLELQAQLATLSQQQQGGQVADYQSTRGRRTLTTG